MALAALLSSVAELPEAIRGEYRPVTPAEIAAHPGLKDKFLLDVTESEGFGLDAVGVLKSNLGAEKARADKAESALKPFDGLPKDAKAKLERLLELEKLDPASEADKIAAQRFDAAKADLLAAHEAEKAPLRDRADKLFTALDQAKRVAAATTAITTAGGNPDVLLPHVLGHTRFDEKDGEFVVQVVDDKGNPRIGNAAGGAMTVDQLVDEFKNKDAFAPLFDASGRSGGGGGKGGAGGAGGANLTGRKKSEMNLNERAEFIEANGMDGYLNLPE